MLRRKEAEGPFWACVIPDGRFLGNVDGTLLILPEEQKEELRAHFGGRIPRGYTLRRIAAPGSKLYAPVLRDFRRRLKKGLIRPKAKLSHKLPFATAPRNAGKYAIGLIELLEAERAEKASSATETAEGALPSPSASPSDAA